jgi:GNAT superfamily N-acetyltransferase
MTNLEELAAAEHALLLHAATYRVRVEAGGLSACLATGQADALLHVAVPSGPEPRDWRTSVEALLELGRSHGIVPRLEFMAELHPTLPSALERSGFRRLSADPVMTTTVGRLAPPPGLGASTRYRRLDPRDGARLRDFVEVQADAFGMPRATGYAFLERMHRTLAGGDALAALLQVGGALAAGACLQRAGDWAELVGVFTVPAMRRRGLARALCATLLADATAAGIAQVWLSAAGDAERLYRRLGFMPVGTQLNYHYAPLASGSAG